MKKIFLVIVLLVLLGCSAKKSGAQSEYTVIKQETYGGTEQEKSVLINSRSELAKLYREIGIKQLPEVDFENHSVVAFFMGEKSTGGYSINITGVAIKNGVATITLLKSAPSGMATMALTRPYCIATIAKVSSIEVK